MKKKEKSFSTAELNNFFERGWRGPAPSLLDVRWDSNAGQGQKIIVFSRLFIQPKETGIENCNY